MKKTAKTDAKFRRTPVNVLSSASAGDVANGQQPYMVVVIDVATMDGTSEHPPLSSDHIVIASSTAEAARLAEAEDNLANDYAPDDDGGFIAINAYSREDLQRLLARMNNLSENPRAADAD
jgi:hypothetical protein